MGEGPGGEVGGWVRAFCFYEACSPLPMGEGPGVRSGFGEAFCDWLFGEAEDFPAHGDTKNPPPVEEGEGRGGYSSSSSLAPPNGDSLMIFASRLLGTSS